MEMNISVMMLEIWVGILFIIMGSLYLRKKSVVLSPGTYWGFFIIMFILMFISFMIGEYFRHLEMEEEFKYISPPSFAWYIYLIPIIATVPLFLILAYIFRNGLMIFNISDEHLSINLNNTLEELKWEYDRDFTYIHVRTPKIKIKVAMMEPMRTCQIFFRDVEDTESIKRFKNIFKAKVRENIVMPHFSLG
jgi:hypothetical protein